MSILRNYLFAAVVLYLCRATSVQSASVWKVIAPDGSTLYLGGSIHALRSTDYPLPAAYNRAFDASARIAFEVDEKALMKSSTGLDKAGQYSHSDNLKNHVDPRTYDYLRRLFRLMGISEAKFAKYRPWYLALVLESFSMHGRTEELGVERFIMNRAQANSKPTTGLESAREHMDVFAGLSDRQGEAYLLLEFIPSSGGTNGASRMMNAWRGGNADEITGDFLASYSDFPSLRERLLGARNRNWLPKIESYLRSGQIYFVVVGAAHLGGREGLLSLLKAQGNRIEQL